MLVTDASRTRRVNIVINETLIEWASSTAETRGISVSAFVREALEKERERCREEEIARAAEALAPLYSTDSDLVAFTALDGEDFA
jgi:post-segregation antitoxin (ccd killing protein)